ncbi:MAG: hypothetical protein QOK48_1913 [Blastocatellia bacterium]|jgi:hypothetical protein|nr:hypothetical protein [Blastocatellia bacterium]
MALSGELNDLSLAELIEFFCNQRKTGRLKVIYSVGPGYFYLQSGSVVHARIGVLRGIEAVYYSLTLPNASFTFSPAFEAPEQTINQPWTSVVLEGLRRMDEGVKPSEPFPEGPVPLVEEAKSEVVKAEEPSAPEPELVASVVAAAKPQSTPSVKPKFETPVVTQPAPELPYMEAFVSQPDGSSHFGSWRLVTVIAATILIFAVVGVPWGWYARSKAARTATEAVAAPVQTSQPVSETATANETPAEPVTSESVQPSTTEAELAARRLRDARAKERAARLQEAGVNPVPLQPTPAPINPSAAKTQSSPAAGSKKATVQVTYDENGRVTQASGGDATALRIARQKRFPAGKAGSATITIPIN